MMDKIYEALSRPIPQDEVKLKVQAYNKNRTKGLVVAYVDARTVQGRLNEVLGVLGWGVEYEEILMTDTKWAVKCKLSLYREDGTAVVHSDVGEGTPNGSDTSNIIKGAYSDAFKRAAVHIGIGRELYALPEVWAELQGEGNYKTIKDEKTVRRQLFGGSASGTKNGNGSRPPSSTRRADDKPKEQPKPESNGNGKASDDPGEAATTPKATSEQIEKIKALGSRVLKDDYSKILKQYEPREDFRKARLATGNEIDAMFMVMNIREAETVIKAIEGHEKTLAQTAN